MYKRSEGFFKAYQDTQLFFQIWENPQARGTILFTHGQGEHSECYHRLIDAFDNDSWDFYGWDLRGHGRSEGRRGYVAHFDDYCEDFKIFFEMVSKNRKHQEGPLILFCHSMGGLIQLKTLIKNSGLKFDGMIVSAPLLGLTVPVPAFKAKGAVFLHKVLPQLTMSNELTNDMLTRDLDVIREYEQDALRTDKISSGAFLGFLESFDFVMPRAGEIKKPALFIVSDADPIISTSEVQRFFDGLGSTHKKIILYPHAKHELINDIDREFVFADIKKYLDGFLES